jgi:hypothetical protein
LPNRRSVAICNRHIFLFSLSLRQPTSLLIIVFIPSHIYCTCNYQSIEVLPFTSKFAAKISQTLGCNFLFVYGHKCVNGSSYCIICLFVCRAHIIRLYVQCLLLPPSHNIRVFLLCQKRSYIVGRREYYLI